MKQIWKRLLCIGAVAMMLGGNVPLIPGVPADFSLTACAGDCYEFDAGTRQLTLKGAVDLRSISKFEQKHSVKSVFAEKGTVFPESCFEMFYDYNVCEKIDLSNADTSAVTSMEFMFLGCSLLEDLNLSNWNTSKVTNMYGLFRECSELKSLDLSSFDTSNVTNMSAMFEKCNTLESIDLSSFDTGNVKEMTYMFAGTNLKTIDLSGLNTNVLRNIAGMFDGCESLTSLDLSGLITSKVVYMQGLFNNCINLTEIAFRDCDTSHVIDMSRMFANCCRLNSLDLSSFDTNSVENMGGMFDSCKELESLDLSNFDTRNAISMAGMFQFCYKLKSLDISSFDTRKVEDMSCMFKNCNSMTSLDLSHFTSTPSQLVNMSEMFSSCSSLQSIKFSNLLYVDSLECSFTGCKSLRILDLSMFRTDKCRSMQSAFSGCSSLTTLDLSSFSTEMVDNKLSTTALFWGCKNLYSLKLGRCFGSVTEDFYLPNGKGWVSADDTETVISGSRDNAEIDEVLSIKTYLRLPESDVDHYDLIGLKFPAPGTKVRDSLAELRAPNAFYTVDTEHTGWVDAHTGEMLDADAYFQFGGAYFLAVRLVPNAVSHFAAPTEIALVESKIYANDGKTQFCEGYTYSGVLNTDGSLEYAAALSDYRETKFVIYEYPDGRKACAFPLLNFNVKTPDAHTIIVGTMYMNSQNQVPTGAPDYECSLDGETWYHLAEIDGIGIRRLKADTEYTVYVRTAGAEEPFYSTTVKTPASEEPEPVYQIDVTDVKAPDALEQPVASAAVSGDGALLCKDSGTEAFGTAGVCWVDDSTGKAMPSDAQYLAGQKYTVQVLVSAAAGYALPDPADITATVNGNAATVLPTDDGTAVIVTYQFTAAGTNTVQILFDANGGSGKMNTVPVEAFTKYTLPECSFTAPANMRFVGWKIGDTVYAAGDEVTFLGFAVVTATWEQIKCTLTFAANGGSGECAPITADNGAEVTLPACTFTFANKRFTGWLVGGVLMQAGDKITVTADMTIYAMWEYDTVTVKLNANGGEGTMPDTVLLSGSAFTFPVCTFTAPEGKHFTGWQLGEKTYAVGDTLTITENTEITALWSKSTRSIQIGDVNGDDTFDQADAMLLSRYTAGWDDAEIDLTASDLNADGTVDIADAMILSRYVAGWDGYDKYIVSKTV